MNGKLPSGVVAYSRSPTFTEETVPEALLHAHETKRGVWALIHVLEGTLLYKVDDPPGVAVLEPGRPGTIAPNSRHHVEPLGPVKFFIEFFRPERRG